MSALSAEIRTQAGKVRKANEAAGGLERARFRARPGRKSLKHARRYLELELSRAQADRLVAALRHGTERRERVEDVLRAARRSPLPASDPQVARQRRRAMNGKPLRPALVVTLPDGRDDIADGMHELSAIYHEGPKTKVPVVHAGREQIKGATNMSRKAKQRRIEKTERRRVKTLTELHKLSKRDDLEPHTRESIRKSQRELQLNYLRDVSPAGAAAWEASMRRAGQWDGA